MKHLFIINPVAGTGKAREYFLPRILTEIGKLNIDYKVHLTTGVGDGERYVKRVCKSRQHNEQTLRFYACGGDGTLNEVVNGAAGFDNVEIASIPAGTGNDFVRNFENKNLFRNIQAQLNGESVKVDLIQYQVDDGPVRLGVNLINIGIDCRAVHYMEQAKRTKIFEGTSAYIYGVARAFLELKSVPLRVQTEGMDYLDQELTILVAGNGNSYGGGFKAAPLARVDDGKLDLCTVKKIGRAKFAQLISGYQKGQHIHKKSAKGVVDYVQIHNMEIFAPESIDYAVDGELSKGQHFKLKIAPQAFSFVVPKSAD